MALTASVEPSEGLSIRVSDTGIGMAAEDIAIALGPFGQVEGSLTRRHEGTGLGLPLNRTTPAKTTSNTKNAVPRAKSTCT